MDTDSQVVVLLCWMIDPSDQQRIRPLGPKEWSEIERKIAASTLEEPSALLGLSPLELSQRLEIELSYAERIAGLLDRTSKMEAQLDRLAEKGIGVLTRISPDYPSRLLTSLKQAAPPVLFIAGKRSLLNAGGIAVVGSRNIDDNGRSFAETIGRRCAAEGLTLISGGARGTDAIAMQSAVDSGGGAVGVLADSLERTVRGPDLIDHLDAGKLALITPYSPSASFTVGAAMGRNKIIYGLADYCVVVSSEAGKGGTWSGATEALKGNFCPVFVRTGESVPQGNRDLVKKGALEISETELNEIEGFHEWMKRRTVVSESGPTSTDSIAGAQASLFD